MIADILVVDKITCEQSLYDFILEARLLSPTDDAMRIDRVGDPRHSLELEIEIDRAPRRPQCRKHVFRVGLAAEFGFEVALAVDPFRRHVGVELKRVPSDLNVEIGPPCERGFKAALAYQTPGTDGVGNDIDFHAPIIGVQVRPREPLWITN